MRHVSMVCRLLGLVVLLGIVQSEAYAQWDRLQLGTTYSADYLFASEDAVLMSDSMTVYYFSDEGGLWNEASSNKSLVHMVRVAQQGSELIGIVSNDTTPILRSIDWGMSWGSYYTFRQPATRISPPLYFDFFLDTSRLYVIGTTTANRLEGDNEWTFFLVGAGVSGFFTSMSHQGHYYFISLSRRGMFRRLDGEGWKADTFGIGYQPVRNLKLTDDVLFGSLDSGGICRTTNQGDMWLRESSVFPDSVHVHSFFPYGWILFASTDRGIYRTTNGGNSWTTLNAGFPELGMSNVRGIGVHRRHLYAGLKGRDAWRLPLEQALPAGVIVDLDTVPVGAIRDTVVAGLVRNQSSDSIWFVGAALRDDDMGDFALPIATDTIGLAAGESMPLQLHFKPTRKGDRHTTLIVRTIDRAKKESRTKYILLGTGRGENRYEVVTPLVNFGMVQLGSQDSQTIAAIRVTGAGVLGVDSINVSGADASAFYVVGGSFDTTLNTGDLLSLQVGFRPGRVDTLTGALRVWGGGSVLAGISLRGIGIEPPVSVPGDRSLLTELRVIPSPVIGRGMIRYVANHVGTVSIGLYNMQSQQVWSQEGVIANPGEQLWTMDVRDLPDGVYVVRVVADGGVLTRKVVITQ